MYIATNPLAGLPDDGRPRTAHEIENSLSYPPAVAMISSAIDAKTGFWCIDYLLHQPNTYGELLFWEWLANENIDTDKIATSNSKIAFYTYQSGTCYERDAYRNYLNGKCKAGMNTSSPAWMNKFQFYQDLNRPITNAWMVPVQPHLIANYMNNTIDEINTSHRLTRIGWALWRTTRDFEGRVGFFDGAFACEYETDAIVLSNMCETLAVYRYQPDPVNTASSMI